MCAEPLSWYQSQRRISASSQRRQEQNLPDRGRSTFRFAVIAYVAVTNLAECAADPGTIACVFGARPRPFSRGEDTCIATLGNQ